MRTLQDGETCDLFERDIQRELVAADAPIVRKRIDVRSDERGCFKRGSRYWQIELRKRTAGKVADHAADLHAEEDRSEERFHVAHGILRVDFFDFGRVTLADCSCEL